MKAETKLDIANQLSDFELVSILELWDNGSLIKYLIFRYSEELLKASSYLLNSGNTGLRNKRDDMGNLKE